MAGVVPSAMSSDVLKEADARARVAGIAAAVVGEEGVQALAAEGEVVALDSPAVVGTMVVAATVAGRSTASVAAGAAGEHRTGAAEAARASAPVDKIAVAAVGAAGLEWARAEVEHIEKEEVVRKERKGLADAASYLVEASRPPDGWAMENPASTPDNY